jgi:hypothetical protein
MKWSSSVCSSTRESMTPSDNPSLCDVFSDSPIRLRIFLTRSRMYFCSLIQIRVIKLIVHRLAHLCYMADLNGIGVATPFPRLNTIQKISFAYFVLNPSYILKEKFQWYIWIFNTILSSMPFYYIRKMSIGPKVVRTRIINEHYCLHYKY